MEMEVAVELEDHDLTKVCYPQTTPLCQQSVRPSNLTCSFTKLSLNLSLQTCQSSVQLELRQSTRQCLAVVTVSRYAVDLEANDIIAAVHVKSVICGSTACASQFYQTLRTTDEQTIHSRCGFTKEKHCHQRKSISARSASTKRCTDEHQ